MKELHEMTKGEILSDIRYGSRQMRKLEIGDSYDFEVNSKYWALIAVYAPFIEELSRRGITKTDARAIDTYYNARWRVDKALEAVQQ